jgi:PEP-CTERM motif
MSRRYTGLGLILLAYVISTPPITIAGGQLPSWTEIVDVDHVQNPDDPNIFAVSTCPTNGTFLAWIPIDYIFGPYGTVTESLVDYQGNPGPVVLHVTVASLDISGQTPPTGFVGLEVFSYAASPLPPQFDSPPTPLAFLGEFWVPTGNYSSAPYDVTLTGPNIGGGVCFLLEVDDDVQHGEYPYIEGTAVPEPSSFLTMVLGMAGVAVGCASRRVRGRFFGAAARESTAVEGQPGLISPR